MNSSKKKIGMSFPKIDLKKTIPSEDLAVNQLKSRKYSFVLDTIKFIIFKYSEYLNEDYNVSEELAPYTDDISKTFKLGYYINASFVEFENDLFIACQQPKKIYHKIFFDFVEKSDADYIICLESQSEYLKELKVDEIVSEIKDEDGNLFISEVVYTFGNKKVNFIKCHTWPDHDILPKDKMDQLYEYTNKIPRNKRKIVCCKAGVGRTGTFIMFRLLKNYEKNITPEIFISILKRLREQRMGMVYDAIQLEFLAEYFISDQLDPK